MPNLVNRLVVQELARELGGAEGMLILSFGGLTVKEAESLRTKLSGQGVRLRMVRNSLARRVMAERGFELPADLLSGNTAFAYGAAEAAVVASKVVAEPQTKKAGKVGVRAAVLEGRLLSGQDAAALASVPDKPTLRAQILGLLSGPARGLARVLHGPPGGVARVLDARAGKLPPAPDAG